MDSTTPAPATRSTASLMTSDEPAAPVPVAVLARTSTLYLQDPLASLQRQYRSCEEWLPAGWYVARFFWDVESGAIDIEDRSQTASYAQFTAAGLPRDGGMAELLEEAAGPEPAFSVVVCEDIERSGRDTFNALKLERELQDRGVPLFATDEPASVQDISPTTVLVRRVKQGVAEYFRLQIKKKAWEGLRQHTLSGWNIGAAPYGYTPERVTHPVPLKAAQGRTKTRLLLDPLRGPVVAAIYTWRVNDHLGVPTITQRLNADHGAYPPPDGQYWLEATVAVILANPKYTGYMVYGRRRKTGRGNTRRLVPPEQWIWSPEPTHPAIITRDMFDAAQAIAAAAPHRRRRPQRQPPAAGPPHLRAARTGPPPHLPAADVRHHPHRRAVLGRRPRLLEHLLQMHPRHRQPQTRRRPPRPPPHRHHPRRHPHQPDPRLLRHPRVRPRPRRPARHQIPATAAQAAEAPRPRPRPARQRTRPHRPGPAIPDHPDRHPGPRPRQHRRPGHAPALLRTLRRTPGRTRGHPDPARHPRPGHRA